MDDEGNGNSVISVSQKYWHAKIQMYMPIYMLLAYAMHGDFLSNFDEKNTTKQTH